MSIRSSTTRICHAYPRLRSAGPSSTVSLFQSFRLATRSAHAQVRTNEHTVEQTDRVPLVLASHLDRSHHRKNQEGDSLLRNARLGTISQEDVSGGDEGPLEMGFGAGAFGFGSSARKRNKKPVLKDGEMSDEELNALAMKTLNKQSKSLSSIGSTIPSQIKEKVEQVAESVKEKVVQVVEPILPAPKAAPAKKTLRTAGLRGKKNAISLTSTAIERLKELASPENEEFNTEASPTGAQLLRISVRNRGCAGLSYHLSYLPIDSVNKFDEIVEQDGVKVLIDSRALFSVVGSEMDWVEDRLSARFVFNNPNVKDACGCGESFHV